MIDNKDVAALLQEIGVILEIKGENPFKVRAYYTAARQIEALGVPLHKLIEEDKLDSVPGIGEQLKKKITEYVTTGRMSYYEEVKKQIPRGLLEMLRIPSVGPKKVKVLYEKLGITTLQELETSCNENRLLKLDGFGEKSQAKILEGIQFLAKHEGKFLLCDALPAAEALLDYMKKCKAIERLGLAGSLRRWKEVVRDIDILVSAKQSEKVAEHFVKYGEVKTVLAQGDTRSSVRLRNGLQVDLRVVKDAEFPYALAYFTGSKEHNVALRGRANRMGLKVNEYGIFRDKDDKLIKCKDEAEFYKALGLAYIPPELRENMGEIEAAEKGILPKHLLERGDLKGVFHVHTNWSDGTASIEEMAEASRTAGFEYVGLTEHSKAAAYAGGLDEARLKKWMAEIDALNKKYEHAGVRFRILKGTECDILKDGRMDFGDKVLAQLDFVIGSIHSNFTLSEEEQTMRVVKALSNPHVHIFGHPTGRLLLGREGYKINLDKVLEAAKKYGKVLELNAHPQRLDLSPVYLKRAKELGVKISINPDAHQTQGIEDITYGVATARRGWLEKEDVLNTRSLAEVGKVLNK